MISVDTLNLIGFILLSGVLLFVLFMKFPPISWVTAISWFIGKIDRKQELFEPDVTHWRLGDEMWIFDGYECYPTYWGYKLIAFDEKGCIVEGNSKRLYEFDFATNNKYRFKNESMFNRLNPNSEENTKKRILTNIKKYKNYLDYLS